MAEVALLRDKGEFLPAVGNFCRQNVKPFILAATLLTLCNTYFADKSNGSGFSLSKASAWDLFLALSAGEMSDSDLAILSINCSSNV